jgi:hypothetical protein
MGICLDSISSNTDIISRIDPMNIDNTKGNNDDNPSNNHESGKYSLLFLHWVSFRVDSVLMLFNDTMNFPVGVYRTPQKQSNTGVG